MRENGLFYSCSLFNKKLVPQKTIVYIPIWGRHNILELCVNSIKSQTEECLILGVCSNDEDVVFTKSLGINTIMSINLPLGIKYQLGMDYCKLFYPKNVIIVGSDDTISKNYVKNINKYINKYDVVGLKNWKIKEIPDNDIYNLKYNHKIIDGYWGGKSSMHKRVFDTQLLGFFSNIVKEFPFTIGAGRSLSVNILNKINWQVYVDVNTGLDTVSLFKLLLLDNASYITLNTDEFYMTSIKDNSIDMITPKEKYMNSNTIIVEKCDNS